VVGDFNIAPDDRDVWDPAKFEGATHVSPAERAALGELLQWGMTDVFRAKYADDGLYSWWDYRGGSFHKRQGLRIDLILATAPLAARLEHTLIDRSARKGETPSDHAPVIADFGPR
jgi:exodeoxyribonuclease-3